MEKEVAETLAYFSQHASELRQLGKDWGLNEEEIEECIERAMTMDQKNLPAAEKTSSSAVRLKFAARKTWPKFRVFLWIVGVFMVLVGLGALALQDEEIEHRFNQFMEPAVHPFFRYLRLAAAPLHDFIYFYDLFAEECMVSNPLFSREALLGDHACENCETITEVRQITEEDPEEVFLSGPAFLEPVLFQGKGRNVSLETFQSILSSNPFIQQPMLGMKTNLQWASQVKDLLNSDVAEKLAAQPDFYFFWYSKQAWTSQIMRKVFPKPSILGNMELCLRKTIYITGPKADSFQLPGPSLGSHSWYIQGSGSSKMEFTPLPMCHRECAPISVTLQAGDLLTYNVDIYTSTITPMGEDVNIAFQGHFNLE